MEALKKEDPKKIGDEEKIIEAFKKQFETQLTETTLSFNNKLEDISNENCI